MLSIMDLFLRHFYVALKVLFVGTAWLYVLTFLFPLAGYFEEPLAFVHARLLLPLTFFTLLFLGTSILRYFQKLHITSPVLYVLTGIVFSLVLILLLTIQLGYVTI